MQEIITVKLLLSTIVALGGFNIVLVGWIARKYIKRIDSNLRRIDRMEAEHRVFHKSETGIGV